MAQPSTVRRFRLELSDVDRGVYEALDLRVAQHPSENEPFLITRVLAYALNHQDGIGFSKGLCEADEPAVYVRDLTGQLLVWIEIGQPSADRLSKGARACEAVQVWGYKSPDPWRARVTKEGVRRAEEIDLFVLPQTLLDGLATTLGRDNAWTVVRTDGTVMVTAGDETFEAALTPQSLVPAEA